MPHIALFQPTERCPGLPGGSGGVFFHRCLALFSFAVPIVCVQDSLPLLFWVDAEYAGRGAALVPAAGEATYHVHRLLKRVGDWVSAYYRVLMAQADALDERRAAFTAVLDEAAAELGRAPGPYYLGEAYRCGRLAISVPRGRGAPVALGRGLCVLSFITERPPTPSDAFGGLPPSPFPGRPAYGTAALPRIVSASFTGSCDRQ